MDSRPYTVLTAVVYVLYERNSYGRIVCTWKGHVPSYFLRLYYSFLVIFLYVIPAVLTIAANARMYKKHNLVQPNLRASGRLQQNRKASKLVIIVASIFFVCWTPFNVMLTVIFVVQKLDFPFRHFLWLASSVLVQCQASFNPVVYFLLSNSYKCKNQNGCFPSLACYIRLSVRTIVLINLCCKRSKLDSRKQRNSSGRDISVQHTTGSIDTLY